VSNVGSRFLEFRSRATTARRHARTTADPIVLPITIFRLRLAAALEVPSVSGTLVLGPTVGDGVGVAVGMAVGG
jgi:hypothetical protein